jgi:uridine nucleosidase
VTVAQGSLTTLQGLSKTRVADFVHGADGFGNLSPAVLPTGVAASMTAASFLAEECSRRPGQVGASVEPNDTAPL